MVLLAHSIASLDSQIWSVALAARSAASWGLTSLVLLMVVPAEPPTSLACG
jgi:hypothetical protein